MGYAKIRRNTKPATKARQELSKKFYDELEQIITDLHNLDVTTRGIAATLNGKGFKTRRGGPWSHTAVIRALSYYEQKNKPAAPLEGFFDSD